jgi:hypothetical protein
MARNDLNEAALAMGDKEPQVAWQRTAGAIDPGYFRAIRGTLGNELRQRNDPTAPPNNGLVELLWKLDTAVRDAQRERLFAEVEQGIAALLRAAERTPGKPR